MSERRQHDTGRVAIRLEAAREADADGGGDQRRPPISSPSEKTTVVVSLVAYVVSRFDCTNST
jgi:hypothetical protein